MSQKKREMVKLARTLVRAKHAAACDEELALVLPRYPSDWSLSGGLGSGAPRVLAVAAAKLLSDAQALLPVLPTSPLA
jgi:hypothetical protein